MSGCFPDTPFAGARTKMNGFHGKYMVVLYTKQEDCGGRCRYCVKDDSVTSSTIPNEDTILANRSNYSSKLQLEERCHAEGVVLHTGNKFELRIKGNSFTNYPTEYVESFIKEVYDFLNQEESVTLEEAFEKQEFAKDKCVQIVIETRPDQITPKWCEDMRRWGVTTVEIGVQSLDNDVLATNWRGHSIKAVRHATQLIRSYGFELGYQVMLGLYGSTREKDFSMLAHDLWQACYYPDTLKIYPCVLLPNRNAQKPLYELYDNKKWRPITNDEYATFLDDVFPCFPPDVHVNRLQRIFTEQEVAIGVKSIIDRKKYSDVSRCMWQRSMQNSDLFALTNIDMNKYRIISFLHNDELCVQAVLPNDVILGYGRMSVSEKKCILRDLRVLGNPLKVGEHVYDKYRIQHCGIGKSMLSFMERYAKNAGRTRMEIYSSAGCVGYFKKLGYQRENYYTLVKLL